MSLLCLKCTLAVCDERDRRCLLRHQEEVSPELKQRKAANQRRYYANNKEKEMQRVREWQKANKEKLNAYQREYYGIKKLSSQRSADR